MATAPDPPRRRVSPATLLLIAAALVALVSIAIALSRPRGGGGGDDNPAAKDWRMVGWAYAEKGDSEASAAAYRRAAALEPDNAENWSSLGEALQAPSRQVVPEAAAAFEKALKLDPSDPRARYFLAVQKDLRGDHKDAVGDWLALLRDTPPQAPWRADLVRTIEQTAAREKIDVRGQLAEASAAPATAGIPGPTPDQLAAASSIPPSDQEAMVRGMVDKLAARLAANPKDAEGWVQLMRSRMVLNDPASANAALQSGLKAFEGDAATQGGLRSAAAQLGVPGVG